MPDDSVAAARGGGGGVACTGLGGVSFVTGVQVTWAMGAFFTGVAGKGAGIRPAGAATGAATLCGAALVLTLGSGVAGASSLTNGTTTLSTIGTVTTGSPYSSGQQIDVTVTANSTMSASNLGI